MLGESLPQDGSVRKRFHGLRFEGSLLQRQGDRETISKWRYKVKIRLWIEIIESNSSAEAGSRQRWLDIFVDLIHIN